MDREKYLQYLEANNGDCNCLPLVIMYGKRYEAEELEKECNSLAEKVDLDKPKPEDLPTLTEYKDKAAQFHEAVRQYHAEVRGLIQEGNLNVFCHDPDTQSREKISNDGLQKRLEKKEIITTNCASCDQQVDILTTL